MPSLDILSAVPLEEVLDVAEQRLGCHFERGDIHYAINGMTLGVPTAADTWVRLCWRAGRFNAQRWTGFEAAAAIEGVPRPVWMAAAVWTDPERGVVWRADEMTLVGQHAIADTGGVSTDPGLPDRWFTDLRTALANLASHGTDRMCVSQAHLSARIHEIYGERVDTTVTEWACAHGDIGYANLCGPDLAVLDWEDWGMAPVGWDAACLWCSSLEVPELAERVFALFGDVLTTRAGRLSRLLLCANTARAFKRTGRLTPLTDVMAKIADRLLAELDEEAKYRSVVGSRQRHVR